MSKKRKLQHRAASKSNTLKSATRHKPTKPNKKPRVNSSKTSPSTPGAKRTPTRNDNESDAAHDQRPTIPFAPSDRILLVGEGDFSFAASLISHHGCTTVTATVLERDLAELRDKYPHVEQNVAAVLAGGPGCRVLYGVDARKLGPLGKGRRKSGDGGGGDHDTGNTSQHSVVSRPTTGKHEREDDQDSDTGSDTAESPPRKRVDGPKSPKQPKPRDHEQPKNSHLMDRIIFNFPHVGGKSTDVNRQVRHNQELLVSFFRRAEPLLVSPGGSIIVTLFESEPYTLWNVRDLARHCGLRVARSFRFQAGAYPGYRHVRTLGALRDRATGEVTEGAWSGERRAARSYIFVRGGEEEVVPARMGGAKRRREVDEDDDDDEYDAEDDVEEKDEGSEDNDSD